MDEVPLAALEREWQILAVGELADEYRRWAGTEPALAAFDGPVRLIEFLRDKRGSHALKDRALSALLVWARTDPLAARLILQAMLPGLKSLSARLGRSVVGFEELWQILFACLWERIVTYPVERRPSRVAANLLHDTLKRTLAELRREAKALGQLPEFALDELDDLLGTPADSSGEVDGHVDADAVLRRAVAAGAVTPAEAELILETEIDGVPMAAVAERLGVSYNAVKIRRQRAEQRLLEFLGFLPDPSGRSKGHSSVHADDESPHRLLRRLQLIAES